VLFYLLYSAYFQCSAFCLNDILTLPRAYRTKSKTNWWWWWWWWRW